MNQQIVSRLQFPFHLKRWKWYRLAILVVLDCLVILISYLSAYWLRLESLWPEDYAQVMLISSPVYVILFIGTFFACGMYRQVWRFANFDSALLIARCVTIATLASVSCLFFLEVKAPRSIPILTGLISFLLTALSRFSWRWLTDYKAQLNSKAANRCPKANRFHNALLWCDSRRSWDRPYNGPQFYGNHNYASSSRFSRSSSVVDSPVPIDPGPCDLRSGQYRP